MYSIGIDLGGTKIATAVADRQGHVRAFIEVPTHAKEGPVAVIHRMVETARAVTAQAEATEGISLRDIQAVGIGAPGPLNPKTGFVYGPPNLPGWDAVHLQGEIEKQLSLPAFLDNDANAATLAEARLGAGQGFSDIVYVTVSTGIGGGVMLDGKVRHGHAGWQQRLAIRLLTSTDPSASAETKGVSRHLRQAQRFAVWRWKGLAKSSTPGAWQSSSEMETVRRNCFWRMSIGLSVLDL